MLCNMNYIFISKLTSSVYASHLVEVYYKSNYSNYQSFEVFSEIQWFIKSDCFFNMRYQKCCVTHMGNLKKDLATYIQNQICTTEKATPSLIKVVFFYINDSVKTKHLCDKHDITKLTTGTLNSKSMYLRNIPQWPCCRVCQVWIMSYGICCSFTLLKRLQQKTLTVPQVHIGNLPKQFSNLLEYIMYNISSDIVSSDKYTQRQYSVHVVQNLSRCCILW